MRSVIAMLAGLILAAAVSACGASGSSNPTAPLAASGAKQSDETAVAVPQGHPQVVEPTAGEQGVGASDPSAPVGDVNAHAPPLSQVKRELKALNLCGGFTGGSGAPLVKATHPGFVPDPGTSQVQGELPVLTARLNHLAQALGVVIYGISGYRTPAHSVAVGGFANDPHTQGLAEDIGVGSLLRSSAAQISEAEFARYGLYRPFDPSGDPNNTEVNHLQLIPAAGPLSLAQSVATYDPDPSCK
jgi:Peptidase M15